jgi:hypothetical protein
MPRSSASWRSSLGNDKARLMVRTRYEILLARFRMMITADGLQFADKTDAELLKMLRAKTHKGRIAAMEALTSVVPDRYWQARGL